ncbi:hypothetical protein MLPF_0514 [Mycobacterium lepromatosis]|nr:hypothetical protein MLPF_0514 [Mycobacterium lepromatosis]
MNAFNVPTAQQTRWLGTMRITTEPNTENRICKNLPVNFLLHLGFVVQQSV